LIDGPEISRAVVLLIDEHGEDAALRAARRQDGLSFLPRQPIGSLARRIAGLGRRSQFHQSAPGRYQYDG
jgi:hypothetical protein